MRRRDIKIVLLQQDIEETESHEGSRVHFVHETAQSLGVPMLYLNTNNRDTQRITKLQSGDFIGLRDLTHYAEFRALEDSYRNLMVYASTD